MELDLQGEVYKLRKSGYYGYILSKYVDIDFWTKILNKHIGDFYIDNLTDFNYSTCFTLCINTSPIKNTVTSPEFDEFLKKNDVYSIVLEISAIAPYALIKYQKRIYNNSKTDSKLEWSYKPYNNLQKNALYMIKDILAKNKITILEYQNVLEEVADIKLEMRKEHVQVYHCLFQDEY